MTAVPSGAAVIAYLGDDPEDDELTALATQRAANVATMTRAYCRGVGFGPEGTVTEDIAAVIVSATARDLGASPGILREEIGNYSVLYDGQAAGFTVRELCVLNAYRRRAT